MPSEARFNCIISLLYRCFTTLPALPHWSVPLIVRNSLSEDTRKRYSFFKLSSQTMIVPKSHFTTHCRVCKAWGNDASREVVRLLRRMKVVQVDVKRRGDKNVNKWHQGLRSHYTGLKLPRSAHLGTNGLLIWSISPEARPRKPRCEAEITRAGLLQTQLLLPVHFIGCQSIWLLKLL